MEWILLAGLFWGVLMGLAAKQKNRNPWGWGIAGALSWPITLLILAFLPYLCPKCGGNLTSKQGKEKKCPACGSFTTSSRATDIWVRIKQGDFAAAQKFKSASFAVRTAIVFAVFWILCVGAYVYLFEPYGKYMFETQYYHMLKVMLFPPVIVLVGLFLYKKFVAVANSRETQE